MDIYKAIEEELWRHARIRVNTGKTQVWNRSGQQPAGMEELGQRAWRGAGSGSTEQQGVKILGTPLGHPDFVRARLQALLREQSTLLNRIPNVQNLQSAWLLLLYCAAARATYTCRVVAPEQARDYAAAHDDALWGCLCNLLGIETDGVLQNWRQAAQLPLARGGLGLRAAARVGVAAHWASWADCVAMIQARHPDIAAFIVGALEAGGGANAVLQNVVACSEAIQATGMQLPAWEELAAGARPAPPEDTEGEPGFAHGWQFFAARSLDNAFRQELLGRMQRPDQAHLRSQSGPGAGHAFMAVPTSPLQQIDAQPFRALLLRRLRLALPLVASRCRCRHLLDPHGDHRAACATAGTLARRSYPLESATARVCREAGARVRTNVMVRNLNVGVARPDDGRRIEVVADGLPLFHGAQLAVDATMVCALRRNGTARPRAPDVDGAALTEARRRKERTYPELVGPRARSRLVVLGVEVGGRWSREAWVFVRLLARAKARGEPPAMRVAAERAWQRRWTTILAVAAQRALAESLLELPAVRGADGALPCTGDVLEDARYADRG